jgi:hypothetical protein
MITHTGYILDYVQSENGCVMIDGRLWCVGNPKEMFESIKQFGYGKCKECACVQGEISKHIEVSEKDILASSGLDSSKIRVRRVFCRRREVVFSRSLADGVDIFDIREALEKVPEAKSITAGVCRLEP